MTCLRWHRLGERCECGHLTIPTRFYTENGKELSHDKAEGAYLAFLEGRDENTVTKIERDEIPKMIEDFGPKGHTTIEEFGLKGGPVPDRRRGRPKKHADHAARQKAYRERK